MKFLAKLFLAALLSVSLAHAVTNQINCASFGLIGNGVADDTIAINKCITAGQGNSITLPKGTYLYTGGATLGNGTVLNGAGRNSTVILSNTATGTLLTVSGFGAGIRGLRVTNNIAQTSSTYVALSGTESFIDDFSLDGYFTGINMTGVVSRIRHGRFTHAATNAVGIFANGGDTSQVIDDVLMGADSPPNVAKAGIEVKNSSALMITNTSVLNQGSCLLIDPLSAEDNVFSLYAENDFFDQCTIGIKISPYTTGGVYRSRFTDVWSSSATNNDVFIAGDGTSVINGIHFESLHALLSNGSGVTIGAGVTDLSIRGGEISNNLYGVYANYALVGLKIQGVTIGSGAGGLNGNTNAAVTLAAAVISDVSIKDNIMLGNGSGPISNASTGINVVIRDNIGTTPTAKTAPVSADLFDLLDSVTGLWKQTTWANLFKNVSVSTPITSTVSTGTAPFVVASTTQVANLNAATAGTATNLSGGTVSATTATASTSYSLNGVLIASATAPTISSGFGGTASIASSNGSVTFRVLTGGTTGSTGVIAMNSTAPNGWNCSSHLLWITGTLNSWEPVSSTTTTATFQNVTLSTDLALTAISAQTIVMHCDPF